MRNKHALPAALWHQFEKLRFEKTPDLQQKFGSFAIYWSYLQATASNQAGHGVMLDLLIVSGEGADDGSASIQKVMAICCRPGAGIVCSKSHLQLAAEGRFGIPLQLNDRRAAPFAFIVRCYCDDRATLCRDGP
jgi:hypothetical protein